MLFFSLGKEAFFVLKYLHVSSNRRNRLNSKFFFYVVLFSYAPRDWNFIVRT